MDGPAKSSNVALDMKICIIGAGMGGLASALALAKAGFTNIQVFEYASDLGFVGAGIQLAPNMVRILDRLGVWDEIEREAVEVQNTSIRKGADDTELTYVDLSHIRSTYSHPHMVGHRSSLANALYRGCTGQSSIQFFFGTSVEGITSFGPKPSFTAVKRKAEEEEEEGVAPRPFTVDADIVLAADGIKSRARVSMFDDLGVQTSVVDTNQSAYRIMLSRDEMLQRDPGLADLLDANRVTRWIGEKRHVIAYPIASRSVYNISTTQPDTNFASAPSATYTTRGSKEAMLRVFGDFCPRVQLLLDLVPEAEVCEWKLRVHEPLPTWVHGSLALVGDACHPTLPHLNQGAAQAVEDAAVLAVVLGRLCGKDSSSSSSSSPPPSPDSIHRALKVYEQCRKERAETLVAMAAASGRTLHLGEGAAKEERDRQFEESKKAGKGTSSGAKVPDKWADADVQKMIYGFDVTEYAHESFDEMFKSLL